jgi:cysteinyl-tRNA synthetase
MTTIQLHNTLTRRKEALIPIDASNVRMYVCGPTVYDRPHLGNARSVVVYDLLFRLLQEVYGERAVTYARNITDVDDKINAAAVARGISIQALTSEITAQFHADTDALGCLRPSIEPRATEHIAEMIAVIEKLIANGNAYVSEGHVLFDVTSSSTNPIWKYGMLSGRKLDDLQAGARVEVESYKRNAGDFVLWKPASEKDDASSRFESPWGIGRPGWHIECSAMSAKHLGDDFDIHGGGADLMFPHHENEIAQSCCAHPHSTFARMWVHNGFLTVGGEKMSKSLGNFTTVHDLLQKGVKGEVIRLAFLSVKYNEPLDWTEKLLSDAQKMLDGWYRKVANLQDAGAAPAEFLEALADDLNVPRALAVMHQTQDDAALYAMGKLLGLFSVPADVWFRGEASDADAEIEALIEARKAAKAAKNFAESDRIRDTLKEQGILLEDKPGGITEWRRA